MSAEFPCVKVAFATVNMHPRVIPFAVRADFSNYDARPLSIKFVDPFADRELAGAEMMTRLPKRVPLGNGLPTDLAIPGPVQVVELYQHYPQAPARPGFLCLAGVREYHDHPAHSGDPWELHRHTGEGRLFALLETVWRYGSAPISKLNVTIGLAHADLPE